MADRKSFSTANGGADRCGMPKAGDVGLFHEPGRLGGQLLEALGPLLLALRDFGGKRRGRRSLAATCDLHPLHAAEDGYGKSIRIRAGPGFRAFHFLQVILRQIAAKVLRSDAGDSPPVETVVADGSRVGMHEIDRLDAG